MGYRGGRCGRGRRRAGHRGPAIAAAVLLALACGRSGPPPRPQADPATKRSLAGGEVVGFTTESGVQSWRGLRFARPPVGGLRWRAPRPPEPWTGTREALDFGPACPQFAGPFGARDGASRGEPTGDEDCLRLHVYAPPFPADAVPTGDARRPVLFWIHGGGNTIGEASTYDGSALALRHGVIVVTTNYRLGVLGWFRHPALATADSTPEDRSGNYGTLDLIRGLEWVRDNIAAFGGDPGRVTIFGESAGGSNVFSLLISPRARGLFQRAIVESGGLATTPLDEAEGLARPPDETRGSAEIVATLWVQAGRAPDRDAALAALAATPASEVAVFLRSLTAPQLLAAFNGSRLGGMYDVPRLFRDGVVLPDGDPLEALRRAASRHPVPVVLGTNRDESKLFMLFSSRWVTRFMGIPLWLNDARRYDLTAHYQSLMWKAVCVDQPATALRDVQGESVFAYRFDWDEESDLLGIDLPQMLGAAHGLEIPFVFGRLDFGAASRLIFDPDRRPAALALSDQIMSYWTAFAEKGDPGRGRNGQLPAWRAWAPAAAPADRFLVLDTEADGGLRMDGDAVDRDAVIERIAHDTRFASSEERCALLARFVRWGSRISREDYPVIADGLCAEIPLESFDTDK